LLNEEKIGVMNRVMLDQRVVYIKRLLEDSGLIQYGITEAEIKSFASRPVTKTITILIELRKLADNTVMDSGTDRLNRRLPTTEKKWTGENWSSSKEDGSS
jgi:hypothetical protein